MSAGYHSNDPSSRPLTEGSTEPAVDPKKETRELLDQVLEATLEMSGADDPLPPEQMRFLVAVARRRSAEPLTVETVMELVETVLRLRFRRLIPTSALWDKMIRQIAETIFEDPRTNERMQSFWARLCEAAK